MIEYIENIVLPYVESNREDHNKAAVSIMSDQVTSKVTDLFEQSNIHVCLFPPNTGDELQPLDLTVVNKPAKEFLRNGVLNKLLSRLGYVGAMLQYNWAYQQ